MVTGIIAYLGLDPKGGWYETEPYLVSKDTQYISEINVHFFLLSHWDLEMFVIAAQPKLYRPLYVLLQMWTIQQVSQGAWG